MTGRHRRAHRRLRRALEMHAWRASLLTRPGKSCPAARARAPPGRTPAHEDGEVLRRLLSRLTPCSRSKIRRAEKIAKRPPRRPVARPIAIVVQPSAIEAPLSSIHETASCPRLAPQLSPPNASAAVAPECARGRIVARVVMSKTRARRLTAALNRGRAPARPSPERAALNRGTTRARLRAEREATRSSGLGARRRARQGAR